MISFSPIPDAMRKEASLKMLELANLNLPVFGKKMLLFMSKLKFIFLPFIWIVKIIKFFVQIPKEAEEEIKETETKIDENIAAKLSRL